MPGSTRNETLSTAVLVPYLLVRLWASIITSLSQLLVATLRRCPEAAYPGQADLGVGAVRPGGGGGIILQGDPPGCGSPSAWVSPRQGRWTYDDREGATVRRRSAR